MKVVATYNIKGGVGKTSAAVNLATLSVGDGLRTLLWDLDPQGAATFLFRIRPKVRGGGRKLVQGRSDVDAMVKGTDVEGLDLLPADFSYRHMDLALDGTKRPTRRLRRVLDVVADQFDLAILDCPPSISLVSESVFEAADVLLIPLIPSTLSLRTYQQLVQFVTQEVARPPDMLAFLSMVDRRKRQHREAVDTLAGQQAGIAKTVIPAATVVELMGERRAPLVSYAPRTPAGVAYRDLWAELRSLAQL